MNHVRSRCSDQYGCSRACCRAWNTSLFDCELPSQTPHTFTIGKWDKTCLILASSAWTTQSTPNGTTAECLRLLRRLFS